MSASSASHIWALRIIKAHWKKLSTDATLYRRSFHPSIPIDQVNSYREKLFPNIPARDEYVTFKTALSDEKPKVPYIVFKDEEETDAQSPMGMASYAPGDSASFTNETLTIYCVSDSPELSRVMGRLVYAAIVRAMAVAMDIEDGIFDNILFRGMRTMRADDQQLPDALGGLVREQTWVFTLADELADSAENTADGDLSAHNYDAQDSDGNWGEQTHSVSNEPTEIE